MWQAQSQGSGLAQGHSVHWEHRDSRSLRATERLRWCGAPLRSPWSGEEVRTKNDRQPVLRGHGHTQGGSGGSGRAGGGQCGQRLCVAEGAPPSQCSWSTERGQSRCGCRTASSEGVPRGGGGRVGGARREVRGPRDRRCHRCAPSPHGLGGWRPVTGPSSTPRCP